MRFFKVRKLLHEITDGELENPWAMVAQSLQPFCPVGTHRLAWQVLNDILLQYIYMCVCMCVWVCVYMCAIFIHILIFVFVVF